MSALADIKCDNAGYSRHYLMMTEYDPLAAFYFDESHITSSLRLFGEHLREARLRRNMTIEQIAKKLGVSRETVANAEHGKPTTGVGRASPHPAPFSIWRATTRHTAFVGLAVAIRRQTSRPGVRSGRQSDNVGFSRH